MISVSRFRVLAGSEGPFGARAEAAAAFFRGSPGCLGADLVRNLDEPDLWALVSRWENVGSYRRAFNGYEAKVVLVPVLSEAIDEPGAYAAVEDVGENLPRAR